MLMRHTRHDSSPLWMAFRRMTGPEGRHLPRPVSQTPPETAPPSEKEEK